MIRDVDPKTAHELTKNDGYVYIDVRTVPEFEQGHPAGAYNIPAFVPGPGGMQPNPEFLRVVKAHFAPGDKLVLGCAAGGRSARACDALASAGYGDLVNVAGGFGGAPNQRGWRDLGLPVSSEDAGRGYADLRSRAE